MATVLLIESFVQKKRNFLYAYVRHRLFLICKQSLIRVQSTEGIKRIEISSKSNIQQLYDTVQVTLKTNGFGLFLERNFTTELRPSLSQNVSSILKHGDMVYLKQMASTSSRRSSTTSIDSFVQPSPRPNFTNGRPCKADIIEDDVDIQLYSVDGTIERPRDSKLCNHNPNSRCVHCISLEPYDEAYLKEHNIKHMSFHSYIRKQTSGIDQGKYFVFDDINCRIKPGCREHPPWPKGICSKCQPSAITLNRQPYRHVDNVMFENTTIVERFLNYWRITGNQRVGYLYGRYEIHPDVPLGIRAVVAAIYEPPQETTKNTIKLLPDENVNDVDAVAAGLGLKQVGWIFTDLISEDANAGTVKHIRGIETHFLTAQECITAGELQNRHPNACRYATNGRFGSKFVTVCVTGDNTKQVHMEGYAVSAQCMALVRDSCLVPTKDAPELAYVRESSDKQYVPDVFYKENDQYGNDVQRLARPLPVEYLLVDVPASTPLQPKYTFTQYDKLQPFPVENRYVDGHLQDFNALSAYLSCWAEEQFLESMSDFHLLIYLYKMEMLPLRQHMPLLLEAVRSQNANQAAQFKRGEIWKLLESLINASSTGNGGTANYTASGANSASASASSRQSSTHADDSDIDMQEHTWTCDHCTFINAGGRSACEMCTLPQ